MSELLIAELRHIVSTENQAPSSGTIETAEKVEQRTLTRARRAHDRDVIPLWNDEVDPLEDEHRLAPQRVFFLKILKPQGYLFFTR